MKRSKGTPRSSATPPPATVTDIAVSGVPYPKPDRSDHSPNFSKTPENDVIDIGWDEGILSDGRRYRVECWAQDQVTSLTYFFSTRGLENMTNAGGSNMWSVNVVVGDDEKTFVSAQRPLRPYGDQP